MNYHEWNRAIAGYFISGLPAGAPVYLSVDEDALEDIGQRSGEARNEGTSWTEVFLDAVRATCLRGSSVWQGSLYGTSEDGLPRCVGFLGAMVLAASRMAGEEHEQAVTAEHNYFIRFREVLGLSTGVGGRPPGLDRAGDEEAYWIRWNRWLLERGFLPTAEAGSGGTRYVQYPLSQALLREGDKARLEEIFREEVRGSRLPRLCEANTMGAWFHSYSFHTRHLRELQRDEDPRRFAAAVAALLELFNTLDWTLPPGQRTGRHILTERRLTAGFYRREDPITGVVEYLLYPPQPRHGTATDLAVERDGRRWPLRLDRPGWYQPLWPESLDGGARYPLHGDARWTELVVPQSEFWVLVCDPENPDSNVFGNWHAPGVGEIFLLVCQERYAAQLRQLREEKLLEWSGEPEPLGQPHVGWSEYRDCMIRSPDWEDVIAECQDLCEALRPKESASISLSGGLRMRQRWAWPEGCLPQICVAAFEEFAQVRITDVAKSEEPACYDGKIATRKAIELPELTHGHYLIEALVHGKVAARQSLEIVAWDALEPAADAGDRLVTRIGDRLICGALISQGE